MNNYSSKEIIAKLMATENLSVEHANVPTASFDLINRRLLIPTWKDTSDDVYTLLISHEVGHALYTPVEEWKRLIVQENSMNLKQVVNVIEDVRIEKLIQAKYPGTVRAFRAGYDHLQKNNFFGTKDRSIDSYGLIDKINLHYKIGHYGYAKIPFTDDEMVWVRKVNECKTFTEVFVLAQELLKAVEEQEKEQRPEQDNSKEDTEKSDSSGNTSNQLDSDTEKKDSEEKSSEESQINSKSDDKIEDKQESGAPSAPKQELVPQNPISETQSAFERGLSELVDKTVSKNIYVNFGDVNPTRLIVDYKKVHSQISEFYFNSNGSDKLAHDREIIVNEMVESFLSGNRQLVNQLANTFEIKKRARLDSRALVSKTGQLNTNKVHSYRYNEDIFKKVTTIPQGKSHGLLMFIDMSSSMLSNLASTYEQLLTLVLFCRRINIPFDVYGFTDCTYASDFSGHTGSVGDITFGGTYCLRHYFSNKMSAVEFKTAIRNIIAIIGAYKSKPWGIPSQERLNQTPLTPTVLLATKLAKTFRSRYNLDIVNTIFLTDGDDSYGIQYRDDTGIRTHYHNEDFHNRFRGIEPKHNFFVRDSATKKQWCIKDTTKDTLNILREVAGVKVIGFHLCSNSHARDMLRQVYRGHFDKAEDEFHKFRTKKFSEINSMRGYDAYYLLPSGGSLSVGSGEFDSEVDTTVDWDDEKESRKAIKGVVKEFSNFMKGRLVNRIFLSRFIEHIS